MGHREVAVQNGDVSGGQVIRRSFIALLLISVSATLAGQSSPPQSTQPASAFVEPGVLPHTWTASGPKCMEVPDWQVHEYNPNFFILRQSGCIHYEKPFLYLIFGRDSALLEDTGAGQATTAPIV